MSDKITGTNILLSVLKKDILLYSRNTLYLFLTILSLVFFIVIFWLVPDKVDEDLNLAVAPPVKTMVLEGKDYLESRGVSAFLLQLIDEEDISFSEEGVALVEFDNEAQMLKALKGEIDVFQVADGTFIPYDQSIDGEKPADAKKIRLDMGISFSPSFIGEVLHGDISAVTIYTDAEVSEDIKVALQGFIREMAFQLAGRDMPVEFPAEDAIIIGYDRLGDQISMRDKMIPMIAFFMLMMETFALASLISNEVLQRTITALLVTPLRVWHFLMAKTIFGTLLAMGQVTLILLLTGAFSASNWVLLLLTVLLGSLLFTAVAMVVGSAGKDFIGQLMFSFIFLIPLMIPAFSVLFPGSVAAWVSYLPSYPIVELFYNVSILDASWADSLHSLLFALFWVVVLYSAGLFVLKRKVDTL